MQTTLPDLPFPYKGIFSDPNNPRSSNEFKPRAFPMTNLRAVDEWSSFNVDIDHAIRSAMQQKGLSQNMQCTVGTLCDEVAQVWCEEEIRSHASLELHRAVQGVLKLLGIKGVFRVPRGGNPAIIGAPDFSWVSNGGGPPKPNITQTGLLCYKICAGPLQKKFRTRDDKQSFEALEQIYGYLTFNNLRYGILTNWTNTWAIQRVEMNGRQTLHCAGPFTVASQPSILKVFVGMVLLAEKDWFYASPTPNVSPPSRFLTLYPSSLEQKKAIRLAGTYQVKQLRNVYELLPLDFRLCDFILSSSRATDSGCIVDAELRQESLNRPPLSVVCKIVDALRYPTPATALQTEANNYAALHHLQGAVIPSVYGFYSVWGILHALALEPVGKPIQRQNLTPRLQMKMKAALVCIHEAGYLHGDISLDKFHHRDDELGAVFIVDLETCRRSNDKREMAQEELLIDHLL